MKMKKIIRHPIFLIILIIGLMFGINICYGQFSSGQIAPNVSLKDLKGRTFDLSQMKKRPMIILYFFDVDSRPSQEGLLSLNRFPLRKR
jgi:hypothetical protein